MQKKKLLSFIKFFDCVKVDERQIVNGDKDKLPDNVVEYLHRKLKYFHDENESINSPDYNHQTSASSSRVNVN